MLIALANGWCLLMLRGIAAVLMGLAALTEPGITLNVLALLYSAYALIDGGLALLEATSVFRSDERWGVLLVDSIAGMAAGLAAFSWPGITVGALIWVMARRAIVTGVAQTITAMRLRKCTTVEWLPAGGGAAWILFGVVMMAAPVAGTLDLALWVGGSAFLAGPLLIIFGHWLRGWLKSNNLGDYIPRHTADAVAMVSPSIAPGPPRKLT